MKLFQNQSILLGVTGSIAAYKAADLASRLTKAGAKVNAVLTPGAEKFITPLTFQSVTGCKAFTDKDLWEGETHVTHIGLGHNADFIVIAPASADFMAKLAYGFGDSLLAVSILASHCPILLVPAMDGDMYNNPATQTNISILRDRGIHFIGPDSGHLASGLAGVGRMSEPTDIFGKMRLLLSRDNSLTGKRILVTAGGTQEAIDPVRFITNRSSGKQGYAIAQAALDAGADVILITTPASLEAPYGCEKVLVKSAEEMQNNLLDRLPDCDALVMCAAVADFRPKQIYQQKIKKSSGYHKIDLEPTEDILGEIAEIRSSLPNLKAVFGFAAESQDLIKNASEKLTKKKLDMMIANDISSSDSGFEVDQNRAFFLFPNGSKKEMPLMEKSELAEKIIEELKRFF